MLISAMSSPSDISLDRVRLHLSRIEAALESSGSRGACQSPRLIADQGRLSG